jgi:hypothetical protein
MFLQVYFQKDSRYYHDTVTSPFTQVYKTVMKINTTNFLKNPENSPENSPETFQKASQKICKRDTITQGEE